MTDSRTIVLDLSWAEPVRAKLLTQSAPATCEAVWRMAAEAPVVEVSHAIFSGRELGMHLDVPLAERCGFVGLPKENHSAFPAPGDLMYQFCEPRVFAGDEEPVYDISVCYGPDTRLLMPWGWSPANRFGSVLYEDRDAWEAAGAAMRLRGLETITFRRSE